MSFDSVVKKVRAKQILDSRGKKTVEVQLTTGLGKFLASCPSGTSTGKYEARTVEVKEALENINRIIAPVLLGKSAANQKEVDKALDKKLGANATLPVSIAVSRAGAKAKNIPLWKYISRIARTKSQFPKPAVLLIEGGLHGKTELDIQEFMMIPEGRTFREQFSTGKKIYEKLKKILRNKFGKKGVVTGLEGAFNPPISDVRAALDLIMASARGYNVKVGLDYAASNIKKGKYNIAFYQKLVRDYPILFLEDPFGEEDWNKWEELNYKLKTTNYKLLVVGDDLTVTNSKRIRMAHRKMACNAVIIKPNQIGTVSETIEASLLAKSYGWKTIVSHRAGETKDDFIADFAVGIGADFIKAGAPSQKERMAKYNRLLRIEKELRSAI
ncbi:MAG: enolase [Parcubacteria group bacterium Gr01-1014_30]|nr:MAG: enolase [Parcubacteria group bacterium Gr01-1014_30]